MAAVLLYDVAVETAAKATLRVRSPAAFVDHRGELGLDEGLVDGVSGLRDAVVDLRRRECVHDLQQCRLVKGRPAFVSFRDNYRRCPVAGQPARQ
jgi:hypothetical protein